MLLQNINDPEFAGYGVDSSYAIGSPSPYTYLTYVGDSAGPDGVVRKEYVDDQGPVPV